MRLLAILKSLLAICLTIGLLALSSTSGHSATGPSASVVITSISGYDGHAFVFAQVTTPNSVSPAPTGTTHQSPYYAEWARVAIGSTTCPWVWAVYVFNRTTNLQVNPTPPNAPSPDFGTTTLVCASPGSTPVDEAPVAEATARLDLDLLVNVSPAVVAVGSSSLISARLNSTLVNDLNLYLNMAIEDWSVTGWFVDFGDSQTTMANGGPTTLRLAHTYQAAGQYDARVIAYISGHAQAAVYDRYGRPQLIQQAFSVQVGNHAVASTRARAIKRYLSPAGQVTVVPSLDASAPDATAGFNQIDALRGALTTMAVHLRIQQEGLMTIDGRVTGVGRSRLIAWRLGGSPSDAPAGAGTLPGQVHAFQDPLRLQWNAPDRLASGRTQGYVVPMTLYVETHYPDGHVANFVIASSFFVFVNFAAESG
ncbi:MAG: hypothetical protein E6I56_01345 [Chloroflexi bacterium]|nr:MAG: hypothetical protein E6I56_01345 [Chloroflexota bacterium]